MTEQGTKPTLGAKEKKTISKNRHQQKESAPTRAENPAVPHVVLDRGNWKRKKTNQR